MSEELIGIIITVVSQCLFIAFQFGRFGEKLKMIEAKQDKHNNLMERTFKLEGAVELLKEKIDVENHRIGDLEDVQNHCKNRDCLN